MPTKQRSKEKAPKPCRECANWGKVSQKIRVHDLLEKTLKKFETKIGTGNYEPTVAEYVKLLQLEEELGQEDVPKEIKVTWVSPDKTSGTGT